jgi:hypothetical protein
MVIALARPSCLSSGLVSTLTLLRIATLQGWREGDIADQDAWPELQRWLLENLEKVDRVFRPRVRGLVVEEPGEDQRLGG